LLIDSAATASVPPLLAATTVRAGLASALGNTVSGIVSDQVVALAEGGVGSLLAKKASIVLVLLVSLTLGIGGLLANRAAQNRTFAEAPAAPPPQSPPARSASKDQAIEIKGRVLDPDGKPLAGARLLLIAEGAAKKTDKPVRITTDKDGLFRFTAQPTDFSLQGKATLAATAKGLGPDWIEVTTQNKDDLTLHLVKDDVPVEGRILDLEGHPVAGVRVRVAGFMQGDVDAWIEGTRQNKYPQLKKRISPEALGEPVTAVTDKDGRFRLSGLGRDRVMHVLLEGDNIERGEAEVVTRLELPKGLHRGNNGVYPARFDHLAGPAKTITGAVRDKRTGKPIAGIRVACPHTPSWIWATTDAQGRYRLTGVPKLKQYYVAAGGVPYFNCSKFDVVDTPGLEPVTVDFALERGIAVRGKLRDKVTGKPIRGRVGYLSLPDNPNLKDFTDLGKAQLIVSDTGRTKDDGSFTVVAVPGPGLLTATADDDLHYLRAEIDLPKALQNSIPEQWHTLVPIAPLEEDAQSTVRDIALEPARTRNGTVVGPDGKPMAGAHYAGLSSLVQLHFGRNATIETASFTVGGLVPKGSRSLVFVHAEKKLAKVERVRGADEKQLTVRLEPMGTLAGRILDANGQPRSKFQVAAMLSVQREDYKDLPLELLYDYPAWAKILNRDATTDAEGRFHVEGLVPGLKYLLNVKEDGATLESLTREVAVESSKTKDIGDLKIKQASKSGAKEKP
jgi:protocatechuate 3,4-dioxygenase beta subunit